MLKFHQKNCFQKYIFLKEIKNMMNIWEYIIFQNGILKILDKHVLKWARYYDIHKIQEWPNTRYKNFNWIQG